MTDFYEVELKELKILRSESELNKKRPFNEINESFLSFVGNNMGDSPLLQDFKAFHLGFYGGDGSYGDTWADPLRANILEKLTSESEQWYLSFHSYYTEINLLPFEEILQHRFIKENNLNFIVIHSEKVWGSGMGIRSRLFFEVPNNIILEMVLTFWSDSITTSPIEGYLMSPGRLDLLTDWDNQRRDDQLFRDILDQISLAFFTFATENTHMAFITSKYSKDDLERRIELESLQQRAKEIGRQIIKSKS